MNTLERIILLSRNAKSAIETICIRSGAHLHCYLRLIIRLFSNIWVSTVAAVLESALIFLIKW